MWCRDVVGRYPRDEGSALAALPGRLFLDSSTLQTLQQYGEYIYDGGEIPPGDRIHSVPNGVVNVEALRQIMLVGQRANFELALSGNSLVEVHASRRRSYLQWAFEILDYWETCRSAHRDPGAPPFGGRGPRLAARAMSTEFDYLSLKDRRLLGDALLLECDAFLTMDRRLARNALHIQRKLSLRVLEPAGYWELLRPWAPLLL